MSTSFRGRLALPLAGVLVAGLAAVAVPTLSSADQAPAPQKVETQESDVSYGPITLPPATNGIPARVNLFLPSFPMACTNCYLTGSEIDLTFADGRSANLDSGVMLHHIVFWNSGAPDSTCGAEHPMGALGERFFAAGNERTSGDLPPGFGYKYGDAPVKSDLDLMNHSATPHQVYLRYKTRHVPADAPDMKPVRPVWLDMENCKTSEYAIPAGASNRVWTWPSNLTGRVVGVGGHLHDGGTKLDVFNQTTGEKFCTSYASYGTKPAYVGHVDTMSTCLWDKVGTVRQGEKLAIDAYYNSHEAQTDAMGIAMAFVYETDDLAGGTTAPAGTFATSGSGQPGHSHGH